MSIIKLNSSLFRKFFPLSLFLLEPSNDILKCSTYKKVLLLEPQLFARWSWVIRIEDRWNVFCSLPGLYSFEVVSLIEEVKVKFIGRDTLPQSQVYTVEGIEAWNYIVISFGNYILSSRPDWCLFTLNNLLLYLSVELDRVNNIRSLHFPRIAIL